MDNASLNIPIHEPTKKSYTINVAETGAEIIFVSFGFLSHSEIVTKVDAAIGKIFIGELNVLSPRPQLSIINKIGHITEFAHFLLSLFMNTISLKIPTKLGIIPPYAPRHR